MLRGQKKLGTVLLKKHGKKSGLKKNIWKPPGVRRRKKVVENKGSDGKPGQSNCCRTGGRQDAKHELKVTVKDST